VRLERDGPVATVVLDRPGQRNPQHPRTWAALRGFGEELGADVRVVVVRGEGPSFSAGLDRRMFTPAGIPGVGSFAALLAGSAADAENTIAGYQAAFGWLRRPGLVSVAAVQGHAVGAGFQLALACDLRIAASDAQFAMAETGLGLVPDLGGTAVLVGLVGYPRALEICVSGRRVTAAEAARLGLCELVVEPGQLAAATADLVAAVLAAPHGAVTETKALLLAAAGSPEAQLRAERQAQLRRLRSLAGGSAADG
jgi:enoyl-CoA hydratase/carnithine racemase